MDDAAAIWFYGDNVPVDPTLLAPLGRMTWAAIVLHHAVRDTLGIHLRQGLSNEPFFATLGGVITKLEKAADEAGEPWQSEISEWTAKYGRPAATLRDRITHSVAYTADAEGTQALMTSANPRHSAPARASDGEAAERGGRPSRAGFGQVARSPGTLHETNLVSRALPATTYDLDQRGWCFVQTDR